MNNKLLNLFASLLITLCATAPISGTPNQAPQAPVQQAQNACALCRINIGIGNIRRLPCNHDFHHACLDQWRANHDGEENCPVCVLQAARARAAAAFVVRLHRDRANQQR